VNRRVKSSNAEAGSVRRPFRSLTVVAQSPRERGQQPAPVFSLSALKQHQLKAVTSDMILRDLVPAAMLDCHPRLVLHSFEAHLKVCQLTGGECRLAR
jgi:hypothetical protein